MRVSFLGIETEVPDEWQDRSTLTFAIPQEEAGPESELSPGNVVINWTLGVPGDEALFSFLDLQLQQLPAHLQGFVLLERGDLGTPGHAMPYASYMFEIGRPLQQIVCVRHLRDHFVVVTGTALKEHFPTYRERFVAVARELRAP